MNILLDPKIFNALIIVLLIAAAIRWACAGNWAQSGYWASAALLNIFVSFIGK